jgi:hypothetical protein
MTAGYATFQTANNTGVMTGVDETDRGVTSGMLNLSRNLGLVTGASVMGSVFALAAGGDVVAGSPEDIATGMHATFLVAAGLVVTALAIAIDHPVGRWPSRTPRPWRRTDARSASRAPTA